VNAERDRDRLLEDALEQQLWAAGAAPPGDACLDAETIAAWMDGGLDLQAIAMAEAHASNCARCQALLGTAARTTPAIAVTEAQGAHLWRWWFAPLAATAAAVTVWMVVPQDRLTAPPAPAIESPAPESSLAKSDPAPPAVPPLPAVAAPATANRSNVGRGRADGPAPRAEAQAAKREAQAFEARERAAETAKAADSAVAGRIAEVAPTAAPPPPAAPAVAQQAKTFADEQVTARSAPSPLVIWLVGRGGMVQLATDGRTFARLPFPVVVDLTAVTATDERRAVVTTADGRAFQTADGGRTWQRRP